MRKILFVHAMRSSRYTQGGGQSWTNRVYILGSGGPVGTLTLELQASQAGSPKLIRGGKVLGVLSSSASLDLEAAGPTLPNIDTYDQGLLFLV